MAEFPVYDRRDPASLLAWAVAAFNAAVLVVVAVGLLYAVGGLGGALDRLDTVLGLAAYLYLWAVTWWTNRRWLADVGDRALGGDADATRFLAGALTWGAAAGVLLFVPVLVVLAGLIGAGGLAALAFLLLAAVLGAAVAAGVGAFVGGVLGLLDLLLMRASTAWLTPPGARRDETDSGTDIP